MTTFNPLHAPTKPNAGDPNHPQRLSYISSQLSSFHPIVRVIITTKSHNLPKVLGLSFLGLLCLISLSCYLSSLIRNNNILASLRRTSRESMNVDEWPGLILTDPEKKSLVTWIRRCSRGRFADIDLDLLRIANMRSPRRRKNPSEKFVHAPAPPLASPPASDRYLAPAPPPSVYSYPSTQTQPPTANPALHYHPSVHGISYPFAHGLGLGTRRPGPPLQSSLSPPRVFAPAHHISLRSTSVPMLPSNGKPTGTETNQNLQRFVSSESRIQPPSRLVPIPAPPSRVALAFREDARRNAIAPGLAISWPV